MGSKRNRKVCEVCGEDYVRESIGAVHLSVARIFVDAINANNFIGAGERIISYKLGSLKYPRLDVDTEHCEKCTDSMATLRIVMERGEKVQRQLLLERFLTGNELQQMRNAVPPQFSPQAVLHPQGDK